MADYTPEWMKEERPQKAEPPAQPDHTPEPEPQQEPPAPEDEADPSKDVEYELTDTKGLGMVELKVDGVVGGELEDEEIPPGR